MYLFLTTIQQTLNHKILYFGGARGVMVIVVGNGHGETSSKSWTRLIAFSHSTNTLGKNMNPIILPPAMGK